MKLHMERWEHLLLNSMKWQFFIIASKKNTFWLGEMTRRRWRKHATRSSRCKKKLQPTLCRSFALRLTFLTLTSLINCICVISQEQTMAQAIHSREKHVFSRVWVRTSVSSILDFKSFMIFALHSWYLKHVKRWSFAIPTTCMNEYTTVGPMHRKPLCIKSLLMSSAFGVFTGTWRA